MSSSAESDGDKKNRDVPSPTSGQQSGSTMAVPREELISTAVKFLTLSRVQQSPLAQKRAFLGRKGLTTAEVDEAIQRSGNLDTVSSPNQSGLVSYNEAGDAAQSHPAQQLYHGPMYHSPYPAPSRLTQLRDLITFISVISGGSYALYQFYQDVIRPLLFGKSRYDERLEEIEESVQDMQNILMQTLGKVQETLTTVQDILRRQDDRMDKLYYELHAINRKSYDSVTDTQSVKELKTEITSLKGLLLNRHQFPPVPNTAPVLPVWQLEKTISTTTASITVSSAKETDGSSSINSPDGTVTGLDSGENLVNGETENVEVQVSSSSGSVGSSVVIINSDSSVHSNNELSRYNSDDVPEDVPSTPV